MTSDSRQPEPEASSGTAKRPLWIEVPGGSYRIGREDSLPDQSPVHEVRLGSFLVAATPVSTAEYALFERARDRTPLPFAEDASLNLADQPVVGVSWFDAVDYLSWLSLELGLPCRLPSEAEREVAARGGLQGQTWPWGDEAPEDREQCRGLMAASQPHVPGPACQNELGIACMADNVHEWCSDWYSPTTYAESVRAAPRGPRTGSRRVSRGGSWRHRVKFTAVAARSSLPPEYRYADYGFRVYSSPLKNEDPNAR